MTLLDLSQGLPYMIELIVSLRGIYHLESILSNAYLLIALFQTRLACFFELCTFCSDDVERSPFFRQS